MDILLRRSILAKVILTKLKQYLKNMVHGQPVAVTTKSHSTPPSTRVLRERPVVPTDPTATQVLLASRHYRRRHHLLQGVTPVCRLPLSSGHAGWASPQISCYGVTSQLVAAQRPSEHSLCLTRA